MTCGPGCCPDFATHVRSLSVAHPNRREMTKVVTDVHDHHTVDVTEHWHDRQDVTVKPEFVKMHVSELTR